MNALDLEKQKLKTIVVNGIELRYNHNHDAKGRFATGSGSGGSSSSVSRSNTTRRKQLGTNGYVEDEDLPEYNAKALEQIKKDTGYDDKQAKELQSAMHEYFGGDYQSFSENEPEKIKIIDEGLAKMPKYDGEIYRGMRFYKQEKVQPFEDLVEGDTLKMKSISSWSSDEAVAKEAFGSYDTSFIHSVILRVTDNKSGVGVQHISRFGKNEAEVLMPSSGEWRVKNKTVISKKDIVLNNYKEKLAKSTTSGDKMSWQNLINNIDVIAGGGKFAKAIILDLEEV